MYSCNLIKNNANKRRINSLYVYTIFYHHLGPFSFLLKSASSILLHRIRDRWFSCKSLEWKYRSQNGPESVTGIFGKQDVFVKHLYSWLHKTIGPRAFYPSPDNKQFSQIKRQPEWQDSNKCMCCRQYISMLLWIFGLKVDFVKAEALPLPIFAPSRIYPLYLAETTTRMATFQVKLFVFEALFDFLPCLGSNQEWIW